MVEAIDRVTVEVHRAGEPTERRPALEHGHVMARLGDPQRQDRAENPAPDDADPLA